MLHRRSILVLPVVAALSVASPALAAEPPPTFVAMWGHLGSGADSFHNPFSAAIAPDGLLYIADQVNDRIVVTTRGGAPVREFPVPLVNGQVPNPTGIAYNRANGLLYVSDHHVHRISLFTTAGAYVSTFDSVVAYPVGVATDAGGFVYVAASGEDRVVKFTPDGTFVLDWSVAGWPYGLTVDATDNVYVTGYLNHQVRKFTSSGTFLTSWGTHGSGDGEFMSPEGMWFDAAGNVFVCDTGNDRVQKFTANGVFLTKWGSRGSASGQLYTPSGIVGDSDGNLYVVEWNNHRVSKFSYLTTPAHSETWGSVKARYLLGSTPGAGR